MNFLESVNEELKKAVEEGWAALKESAQSGKLRLKLYNLNREAEKRFREIGGIVYESEKLHKDDPLKSPELQRLVAEIRQIEAETEALREEMRKVKGKEPSITK
ncbi:MAG: hypothetical protein K8I01_08355 [Candidatus Methylomirabilis sp.]|nr:hypothetical protein [Deltaproteobacteria bacterium]